MATFYLLVFLGISSTFLLCFLVGFVDFWLNAIYALCPLSIDNIMLLFTEMHPNTVSQRYKHKYNPAVKDIADANSRQARSQIYPLTFDTNDCSPLVLDMSLNPMQLFAKHAAWLKIQHTLVSSAKMNREEVFQSRKRHQPISEH